MNQHPAAWGPPAGGPPGGGQFSQWAPPSWGPGPPQQQWGPPPQQQQQQQQQQQPWGHPQQWQQHQHPLAAGMGQPPWQQGQQNQPGPEAGWFCTICSVWNGKTAKKCRSCAGKKAFVAATPSAALPPSAALSSLQPQQPPAVTAQTPSAAPAELAAKIQALEKAKSLFQSADSADLAANIDAQIAKHKALILQTRPLGAQLDGAKAALARASARRTQGDEMALEAAKFISAADEDIRRYTLECTSLESRIAESVPPPPAAVLIGEDASQVLSGLEDMVAKITNGAPATQEQVVARLRDFIRLTSNSIVTIEDDGMSGASTPPSSAAGIAQRLFHTASTSAASTGQSASSHSPDSSSNWRRPGGNNRMVGKTLVQETPIPAGTENQGVPPGLQ